jgi:hypothetical protein
MSYYNVRPRFTPGSPAMVGLRLAQKVAEEERHAITAYLEGFYGEKYQEHAKRVGLHRIAFHLHERRGGFIVTDLLTHEQYERAARYKVGERVEVWNDDAGWVEHIVTRDYRKGDLSVYARPWRAERPDHPDGGYSGPEVEHSRDLVRAPRSVRVLEPEQLAEVLL